MENTSFLYLIKNGVLRSTCKTALLLGIGWQTVVDAELPQNDKGEKWISPINYPSLEPVRPNHLRDHFLSQQLLWP